MYRVGRQQPFEHYCLWHDEVEVSSWCTQGRAVVLQLELCSGIELVVLSILLLLVVPLPW